MRTTTDFLRVFPVSCALVFSSCTSKLNYDTHADLEALRALKSQPVAILVAQYTDDVLIDAEPVERSLAATLLEQQKTALINQFGSMFSVTDATAEVVQRFGDKIDVDDPAFISRVLRELGAQGGFVVRTAYAYQMVSGNLEDKAREGIAKAILPKKAAGVFSDPSQVQSYNFACQTSLLNSQGRTVWSFYGKASTLPTFSSMFKPSEFLRSFAGLDPSSQNLAAKMLQIGNAYNQYQTWLMQQDLSGTGSKNYFKDYPPDRKDKQVTIFPAEDKMYVPFVKGHGPLDK